MSFLSYVFLLPSIIFIYYPEVSRFFISFISLYSLNTLFTKTNLSWLIYESIKVLEIRVPIVFSSVFPNNFISSYFLYFLIIDLYIFIPAEIAQVLNLTEELLIPTGPQANEANAEFKHNQ